MKHLHTGNEQRGTCISKSQILKFFLTVGVATSVFFSSWNLHAQTTTEESGSAGVSVPVNQIIAPAGLQVELPGLRPQVIAVSPDGQLVAVSGKTAELLLINPRDGKILQRVHLPSDGLKSEDTNVVSSSILKPDVGALASYNGLIFSPDGTHIYLSNVRGDVKVFKVKKDHKVSPSHSISLPHTKVVSHKTEIPAGLALSRDGTKIYVVGNLSNRLLEIELATGKTMRMFEVGVAPYEVVVVGTKAYVSNWGGKRPDAQSVVGPAGRGTTVRVDTVRYVAAVGSVSVIDLVSGKAEKEIPLGLHTAPMTLSPDGRHLVVANAGDDTLSVIDTATDNVCETVSLHWQPKDLFGASPTALVFDKGGEHLYVCNGTQNAVAVVEFKPGHSQLTGLIPTGWYPGSLAVNSKFDKICVANIKGIGSGKRFAPGEKVEFNSHQHFGTVSLISVPGKSKLDAYTKKVFESYGRAAMEAALLPARPDAPARPVPERVGEPSVFKHVIYIIKENRTYDQVLGDMKEGNGDARLCIFGEKATPNQHKLCRDFVLLDNTRCSGVCSADGHNWTDSAFANDYLEKSFAGFPRSYPHGLDEGCVDALAWSPVGFIWDNAIAHGKTLRDYGEFTIGIFGWTDPKKKGKPTFQDCYRDYVDGTDFVLAKSKPSVESLRPYICSDTIGFNLHVLDVWRARVFINELKEFERTGNFPNLILMCLPSDHTLGTRQHHPTPAAKVADNDLAVGQIVDAVSHSKFWKETCIFAIEDDPQAGFDHVSSYRTTAYVASPYTKRHAVLHNAYNQTSLVRTMELMLGLPPMNQLDATATPMTDCFVDQPDLTPFTAVRNKIPLNQMNPELRTINDKLQKKYAIASNKLPLDEVDEAPEDLFNRILWHAEKGAEEYPSWAVTPVKGRGTRD